MTDEHGKQRRTRPARRRPVEILGLSDVPERRRSAPRRQGHEEGAGDRREPQDQASKSLSPATRARSRSRTWPSAMAEADQHELKLIIKARRAGLGRSASADALTKLVDRQGEGHHRPRRRRRHHRGRRQPRRRVEGDHHRLQRAPGRQGRRARRKRGRRDPPLHHHLRRGRRREERDGRPAPADARSRRPSARPRSARSSRSARSASSPAAWSTEGTIKRSGRGPPHPRQRCRSGKARSAASSASRTTSSEVERGLRVRYHARRLQRPQGERHHRVPSRSKRVAATLELLTPGSMSRRRACGLSLWRFRARGRSRTSAGRALVQGAGAGAPPRVDRRGRRARQAPAGDARRGRRLGRRGGVRGAARPGDVAGGHAARRDAHRPRDRDRSRSARAARGVRGGIEAMGDFGNDDDDGVENSGDGEDDTRCNLEDDAPAAQRRTVKRSVRGGGAGARGDRAVPGARSRRPASRGCGHHAGRDARRSGARADMGAARDRGRRRTARARVVAGLTAAKGLLRKRVGQNVGPRRRPRASASLRRGQDASQRVGRMPSRDRTRSRAKPDGGRELSTLGAPSSRGRWVGVGLGRAWSRRSSLAAPSLSSLHCSRSAF